MAIWVKKNGKEITLNDEKETISKAVSLGWCRAEDAPADEDIGKMTRKQLDAVCISLQILVDPTLNKPAVVALIEAAQKDNEAK